MSATTMAYGGTGARYPPRGHTAVGGTSHHRHHPAAAAQYRPAAPAVPVVRQPAAVEAGGRDAQTDDAWDWNWDLFAMPRKWWIGLGVTCLVFVLLLATIYGTSDRCPFDSYCIVKSHTGEISDEASNPGRRFHGGLGGELIEFPRFDRTVSYTLDEGNAINVRVEDGQEILLDMSFQYSTPKDELIPIYEEHKTGFDATIRQIARSILRDEAARHTSTEFFSNRTTIARAMRTDLEAEGARRRIRITGFQIRNVQLPAQLLNNLFRVQQQRLEIDEREAQLLLDQINATTNALELDLRTQRLRGLAEFDQQTQVLLTREAQNRSRIEQTTQQLVAQISGTSNQTVTLYQQTTATMVEGIRVNITIETEITRREVEGRRHTAQTNLTIYNQETDNLKLQYDNNVTRINERARQQTTAINANTTRQVAAFEAQLRVARAHALQAARELLAAAREDAAQHVISAKGLGYSGLPRVVYLAQIAASAVNHTEFIDTNVSTLVDVGVANGTAVP